MSPISKRRGRPAQPDVVMDDLEKLLENEQAVTPYLEISTDKLDEITIISRNRSINVMRCLKMWYELSSEVFIVAVNILDRFLSKMKVQTKHIACASVSSLYIAGDLLETTVNPEDLVNISQSKCTGRDLQRMSNIIKEKLDLHHNNVPITTVPFLKFYFALLQTAADKLHLGGVFGGVMNEQEMCVQLEIIACDVRCSGELPNVVALALVFIHLERLISSHLKQLYVVKILKLYTFAIELKKFCNVNDCEFSQCLKKVLAILNLYNGELKVPYRQRLIWKVSTRTMKKLRPTKQLRYTLPTIREDSNTLH